MKRELALPLILAGLLSAPFILLSGSDGLWRSSGKPGNPGKGNVRPHKPGRTLEAFSSQRELRDFLRKLARDQQRSRGAVAKEDGYSSNTSVGEATAAPADSAKSDDSVTNVQHAGVDEGGIVKLHGDHLVILRRGRLFTVRVGDDLLRPVSSVDAYGPGLDPGGAWYDEMLISSDTVFVIGYSYQRGGTEIGLFRIGDNGSLRYLSTYHLRSNDYYSSRNYASRLVDGKLVFYMPLYLWYGNYDSEAGFPAYRRWRKGVDDDDFIPLASAERVYKPPMDLSGTWGVAIHTVTSCEVRGTGLDCSATSVLGPAGRVFYVSPESVYVWTTAGRYSRRGNYETSSTIYRMPLDGSAPSALGASGSPIDQFSFLESGDGYLNVLVRDAAFGDGMWNSERTAGSASLLRVRTDRFGDGTELAGEEEYTSLPKPDGYVMQNRFVGDFLLYGSGTGWGYAGKNARGSRLGAVRWKTGQSFLVGIPHGIDRIEALGKDAIVIGTDGSDLHFTPIRLGYRPDKGKAYVRRNAAQGELRSHGFFYKPETSATGILGLPIREAGGPGYEHLFNGSASILFLRNDSLALSELGALRSGKLRSEDDNCKASCVDWYGNARPLFLRGRIIALLGYELVEGRRSGGGIRELRRVSFSPASRVAE